MNHAEIPESTWGRTVTAPLPFALVAGKAYVIGATSAKEVTSVEIAGHGTLTEVGKAFSGLSGTGYIAFLPSATGSETEVTYQLASNDRVYGYIWEAASGATVHFGGGFIQDSSVTQHYHDDVGTTTDQDSLIVGASYSNNWLNTGGVTDYTQHLHTQKANSIFHYQEWTQNRTADRVAWTHPAQARRMGGAMGAFYAGAAPPTKPDYFPYPNETNAYNPTLSDDYVDGSDLPDLVDGNEGTITGATWQPDTDANGVRALDFASGDVVDLINTVFDDIEPFLTCSCWVKTVSGARQVLYTQSDDASNFNHLISVFLGRVGYENGAISVTSNGTINDGNWHHVLVACDDGGTVDIYIDGVLDNSGATGSYTGPTTTTGTIGAIRLGGVFDSLVGRIDAIRFWKVKVDAEIAARVYQQGRRSEPVFAMSGQSTTNFQAAAEDETTFALTGSSTLLFAGASEFATAFDLAGEATTAFVGASVFGAQFQIRSQSITQFDGAFEFATAFALTGESNTMFVSEGDITQFTLAGESTTLFVGATVEGTTFAISGESTTDFQSSEAVEATFTLSGRSTTDFKAEDLVEATFALSGVSTTVFRSEFVPAGLIGIAEAYIIAPTAPATIQAGQAVGTIVKV